ncbi:MAG: ATP-binding cassette domain-containing protein [Ignavibacteriota bacterium]
MAVLLVAPAFLIGAALTVPTFSPFERALPLTISQLLWSRILASLALIWLPLLMGAGAMLAAEQSLAPLAKPIQSSANFTACACLATSARLAPKRAMERLLALLALGFAILALLAPPRGVARCDCRRSRLAGPRKTLVDLRPRAGSAGHAPFRGPCHLASAQDGLALADSDYSPTCRVVRIGSRLEFSPVCRPFPGHLHIPHPYLLGLPVSRRHVLWAILAPVIVSFLVGTAFSPSFQGADEIANFTRPTPKSPWREFYGNPPGLMIPTRYYRTSATFTPPAILAPWGETSQPAGDGRRFGYDPYWVGPENSDRFFEWQFARATRAIYGRAFTPPELRDAIRAGLRPVIEQPRAVVVRMALGTALLLALGLLAALKNWYRLRAVPTALRALLPFWLPVTALLVAQVGRAHGGDDVRAALPHPALWQIAVELRPDDPGSLCRPRAPILGTRKRPSARSNSPINRRKPNDPDTRLPEHFPIVPKGHSRPQGRDVLHARGRSLGPARPQRRRQDNPHPHRDGNVVPALGAVRVFGLSPTDEPVAVKKRIGYVAEDQILPLRSSIADLIALHRYLFNTWDHALERQLVERFRLDRNARINQLSKGQARQVALVCAVCHRPDLLILDEPAGGLGPRCAA